MKTKDCKIHRKLYVKGVATCINCGLIFEDDIELSTKITPIQEIKERKYRKTERMDFLLDLNNKINKECDKDHLNEELRDLLAEFDLSVEQTVNAMNCAKLVKLNSIRDVLRFFIKHSISYNLPITHKKIWQVYGKYYSGKEIFREEIAGRNYDYSWYVNKLLNKLSFMSDEDKSKLTLIVIKCYKETVQKFQGLDPLSVIGCFCYHYINNNYDYKNVPKRYMSVKVFKITGTTYRNYKKRGIIKG